MHAMDLDKLSFNIGLVKGYLLSNSAPIEIVRALESLTEGFELSAPLVDSVIEDEKKSPRAKVSKTDKIAIYHMRFKEGKTPAQIAKSYPELTPTQISNMLSYLKKTHE